MKKISLLFLILFAALGANAQVFDGGFETWNSLSYSNPTGFDNSNAMSLRDYSDFNVLKVEGVSGNAVKMVTLADPTTESGFSFISTGIGNPTDLKGGAPFTAVPTAMTFKAKYDVMEGDTALAVAMFKKNGSVVAVIKYPITGSSSSWVDITANLIPLVAIAPDSVIVAFSSSNVLGGVGLAEGSTLTVDDIAFVGTTQNIPNADFELWADNEILSPDQWDPFGFNVILAGNGVAPAYERTTDAIEGSSALKFTTTELVMSDGPMTITMSIANIMNGGIQSPTEIIPLVELNTKTGAFKGSYKFASNGVTDSVRVSVVFLKESVAVGTIDTFLVETATYTDFSFSYDLPVMSDSVVVVIDASSKDDSQLGNVLYLDGLKFEEDVPNGLNTPVAGIFAASSKIFVTSDAGDYQLLDASGRILLSGALNAGETIIPVSLPKGAYIVKAIVNDKVTTRKVIL